MDRNEFRFIKIDSIDKVTVMDREGSVVFEFCPTDIEIECCTDGEFSVINFEAQGLTGAEDEFCIGDVDTLISN